jgi:hypothetical protein
MNAPFVPPVAAEDKIELPPESLDNKTSSEKKSTSTLLVELALKRYEFGCTEDGQPFAVKPGGHVVRTLRGAKNSLRAELSKAYYQRHRKTAPQQALADALLALEGEAMDSDPCQVHLRVASTPGAIWLDLGDTAETVIKIDAAGWRPVTAEVPVLFRRTALTGALQTPVRDMRGTNTDQFNELWQQLNVAELDRPLVLAWLVAAIANPDIPHPILGIFGEQGTGKSTASKRLVELVDPSPVLLRKPPRDTESWVTAAAGSWVVGLDNMSQVPDWLSDSLCRAVTGDGDVRRALYTDGQLAVFAFRRCILLNGIDVGALRGDLADRTMRVSLNRIPDLARKKEADLEQQWRQARPTILGELLTLTAGVIHTARSVRLGSKPRMADFAQLVAALDQLLGTHGLDRYLEQSKMMAEDSLSDDPFLGAMSAAKLEFTGTAAELLDALTPADKRPPIDWPKNARALTGLLKRNAPALRKAGWTVEDAIDLHTGVTNWALTHPEMIRNQSMHSQHSEHDAGKAGKAGYQYVPPQADQTESEAVVRTRRDVSLASLSEEAVAESAQTNGHPHYSICISCGRDMRIIYTGQTTHPACEEARA